MQQGNKGKPGRLAAVAVSSAGCQAHPPPPPTPLQSLRQRRWPHAQPPLGHACVKKWIPLYCTVQPPSNNGWSSINRFIWHPMPRCGSAPGTLIWHILGEDPPSAPTGLYIKTAWQGVASQNEGENQHNDRDKQAPPCPPPRSPSSSTWPRAEKVSHHSCPSTGACGESRRPCHGNGAGRHVVPKEGHKVSGGRILQLPARELPQPKRAMHMDGMRFFLLRGRCNDV